MTNLKDYQFLNQVFGVFNLRLLREFGKVIRLIPDWFGFFNFFKDAKETNNPILLWKKRKKNRDPLK